jgi:hypothetical protein
MPYPPSTISFIGFLLILAFIIASVSTGLYRAALRKKDEASARRLVNRFLIGLFLWLLLVSAFVGSGVLQKAPMPALPIFMFTMMAAAVIFALSPLGTLLAHEVSLPALIAFQSFRLPLELVLHEWVRTSTIPETMTWTGSNFDIVTGILALPCAVFARHRTVSWLFNLIGFALLLNVMRVAILSSPLPFAWGVTPPLELALYLPYSWIVPLCVGGALAGHLILTRALFTQKDA